MNVPQSDADQRNPLLYLFGKVWMYSEGRRYLIVLYWTFFIIANAVSLLVSPFLMRKVFNTIQEKDVLTRDDVLQLIGILALNFCVTLVFWAFHGPARIIERRNAFWVETNYRKLLLRGVMGLSLSWHTQHESGDTADKMQKGASALHNFSSESFQILMGGIRFVVSMGMLMYFSWTYGLIALAFMTIAILITIHYDTIIFDRYKKINKIENRISAGIIDSTGNILSIIILRGQKLVFEKVTRKILEPFGLLMEKNNFVEIKWFFVSACSALMAFTILSFYLWPKIGIVHGVVVGNLFLLVRYLDELNDVFFRFTGLYSEVVEQKAKVANSELLVADFRPEKPVLNRLPEDWRQIDVRGINFTYASDEGRSFGLKDINLSIGRGERIAFVGSSGGGKTTCLYMLGALYDPEAGSRVSVDGMKIAEGLEGIAGGITLFPQEPQLFADTILYNLTLGKEYSPELLRWAMDTACFTEVLETLPKGLESVINERGVNLSVGQKLRLSLARGLLIAKDSSVVLLDEPTSALDALTERKVYERIFAACRGKTVISSIHRLHLLDRFDKIFVFRDGRIVDSGRFDELRESSATFKALWASYLREHAEETAQV